MLTIQFQQERCLFVTEATQFCITADSTLIFKSVQLRELGQSPICCVGGAQHHVPRAEPDPSAALWPYIVTIQHPEPNPTPTPNAKSVLYPYMKVTTTYNYVAGLQSLQCNGCCCDTGPVKKLAIFGTNFLLAFFSVLSIIKKIIITITVKSRVLTRLV